MESATDVKMLVNHNYDNEIGSTSKGNLKLKEDAIGLYAEAEISDPVTVEKAKNNELRGWSFGFGVKKQSWGKTDDPNIERRFLEEIILPEVSIIDNKMMPCYSGTSIEVRSNENIEYEVRSSDNIVVELIKQANNEENKVDEMVEDAIIKPVIDGVPLETTPTTKVTEEKTEKTEVITTETEDKTIIEENKMEISKKRIEILKLKGITY